MEGTRPSQDDTFMWASRTLGPRIPGEVYQKGRFSMCCMCRNPFLWYLFFEVTFDASRSHQDYLRCVLRCVLLRFFYKTERNQAMVSLSPSFNDTVGCHSKRRCACVMSGLRRTGSSWRQGKRQAATGIRSVVEWFQRAQ